MKNNFLKTLQKELGIELYNTACSSFEKAEEGDLEGLVAFVFLVNQKNDLFNYVDFKNLAKKLSKKSSVKKETILILLICNEKLFKEILKHSLNIKEISIKQTTVARPAKTKSLEQEIKSNNLRKLSEKFFNDDDSYSGCGGRNYSSC